MAVLFVLLIVASLAAILAAGNSPISVVANVRGKKFEVVAETVGEFNERVEALTGMEASAQSVLFRGKALHPSDRLQDLGVSAGDILNVVKGRKQRPVTSLDGLGPRATANPAFRPDESSSPVAASPAMPSQPLDEAYGGVDSAKFQEEAMNSMNSFLDSDLEAYFGDAERLEQARQQMLANIDQYEKMMPGFREKSLEIASDPQKWQEAMLKAKESLLKIKQLRDSGNLSPEAFLGQQPPAAPPAMPDTSVDDFSEEE